MLRASITKVKRACALARIPSILRGDFQNSPCNFDKISGIFMKSKSTTSCSNDDEDEKCKRCKQLIELAFGPEMPPGEGIEEIGFAKIPELHAENITPDITRADTICERDKRITSEVTMSKEDNTDEDMPYILKATKIEDEDKFGQKVEIIKEPYQSFKRSKDIHIDRETPVLLSNKNSKKQSSGDTNMLEMLAKQSSDTTDNKVLNEIEKLGISQKLLKDITNNSFGNEGISTNTLKKDTSKPDKISEIDLETRVLEKDQTKMSKRNFINRRAMKHLAMHMGAEDITKNITSRAKKSGEVKMKKDDDDSSNKLIDDRHFRIELKIPFEREKVLEKDGHIFTSKILTNDRPIRTENENPLNSRIKTENDSYNILTYDRHIKRDQIPLDREKIPEINREKVHSENISSNILTDDRHFRTEIKNSPIDRETLPQIAREKVELGNVNIKTQKEPTIATDDNDKNEPVILVKECKDPDCFRITPETPKAQTLTDQLIALNLKIQNAMAAGQTSEVGQLKVQEEILAKEVARQNLTKELDKTQEEIFAKKVARQKLTKELDQTQEEILIKEVARQKLTKEMDKIFKDDIMPRHLLSNLTVVSKDSKTKAMASKVAEPSAFGKANTAKMANDQRVPPHMFQDLTVLARNVPKESELKKAIENFFEQEHDPVLIKPDRLQYSSPNDDIVEDKDYSVELDPRVVIREDFQMQPEYTEPHSPQNPLDPNYYSNYFNSQGNPQNIPPQNPYEMPSQNPYNSPPPYGGPQNIHFYKRAAVANAVVPDVMPQNKDNQIVTSDGELPPKVKTTQDDYKKQPNEIPLASTPLPHIKMPHAASSSTVAKGKLTENISTSNINTVKGNNTAHEDNLNMTSSTIDFNKKHIDPSSKKSAVKLEENTNNLPNRVIQMTESTTDKKSNNIKDNLNRSIMPGLTPETSRFKVRSESMDTAHEDNLYMTSSTNDSNKKHIDPYSKKSAVKLEENTNNLPNKVIQMTESTMDKKNKNIKDNLKRSIMPGLTPETARFKVKSDSMETPIKIRTDRRKTKDIYAEKPVMKPAKHYGFQSKATVSPWIDKGAVTLKPQNLPIATEEPKNFPLPALHPNMTLSEMLKTVRERARLEICQQFILSSPARKVKTPQGSCKKPKKPPCPPPQKTCPSSEPKCPPPECPKPPPPPKPCKPCCPDPCATPKCPPPEKKDPCAKFNKTECGTDVLGLVVTLGPMGMPELSAVSYLPSDVLPDDIFSNSMFKEEMFLCGALPENISLTEFEDPLMAAIHDLEDDTDTIPDLLHKAFIFPKNYEPWIPIPSWPIPRKVEKKKLVCPKDGCKVPGPPPPGARCGTIHHPCAGFPNDKKRT